MKKHLAECMFESPDESRPGWRYCICDRLYEHGQKVRMESGDRYYRKGHSDALISAREALEALDHPHIGSPAVIQLPDAIAAIQALRNDNE